MNNQSRFGKISAALRIVVVTLAIGGSGTMLGGTIALADHYADAREAETPTLVTRTIAPKNPVMECDNVTS